MSDLPFENVSTISDSLSTSSPSHASSSLLNVSDHIRYRTLSNTVRDLTRNDHRLYLEEITKDQHSCQECLDPPEKVASHPYAVKLE